MLLSLVATAEKVSSETRRVRSFNSQRRLNQPIELTPLTSGLAKLANERCIENNFLRKKFKKNFLRVRISSTENLKSI